MITVYGKTVCPQCTQVTTFLKAKNVRYNYLVVGEDVEIDDVEMVAGRAVRSIPVIMQDGTERTFADLRRTY